MKRQRLLRHTLFLMTATTLILQIPAFAQNASLDAVEQSLLDDIRQSQRRLSALEQRIAKESTTLSEQVGRHQAKVRQLRQQAAVAQRAIDEQTLGLETLQNRLKTWTDQDSYQRHLLKDFVSRQPEMEFADSDKLDLQQASTLLTSAIQRQKEYLQPTWRAQKITRRDGRIVAAQTLSLGPVSWYLIPDTGATGLLERNIPYPRVLNQFDSSAAKQLNDLYQTGTAAIVFDPTLNQALKIADTRDSLLSHLTKGGIWVVPILSFALISLLIALTKTAQYWRLPKLSPLLSDRLQMLSNKKNGAAAQLRQLQEQLKGAQAELVAITLQQPQSQQRDDKLFACLLNQKHDLEKYIGAIAITAAVAPLLGLLGTVSGMIETFKMMTIFGAGDPSAVSGGISEALVTTELGLIVAIPALIIHALLTRQAKAYCQQLESSAINLSKLELS